MVKMLEGEEPELSVPENIESSTAKLVWLWLATNGAGTSKQISGAVDVPLSKVLRILPVLAQQGAVESESAENSTMFAAC